METVRIDRWLCAARVFKSRSQATQACAGGRVKLNGNNAKPGAPLRPGDEVRVQLARGLRILGVLELAERRLSPPLARELYDDRSPPPEPRERGEQPALRPRGAGRPTKRDRRELRRLRRRD